MIKVKIRKTKNPKDEEFLELIKIKKEIFSDRYIYKIYYRNEQIGQFEIKKDTNYIWEMEIQEKYKRKGLATFMHKYIEKDLGIKIVPSNHLTREGKLFYGIKPRTNPTDHELLSNLIIEKDFTRNSPFINYSAYLNNKLIAKAIYDDSTKQVELVRTLTEFQRKGVATLLYDYIEKDQKLKLKPSGYLLPDGKAFWKSRRKTIKHNKIKNPTDFDLISKLIVKKSFPDYGVMYEIYLGKKRIGFADIDNNKREISFVNINKEYRRKGVSTFLYNYIEKDLGYKLKPSEDLLEEGEAFWKNRLKKKQ